MARKTIFAQKELCFKSEDICVEAPYPNFTWNGDRVLTSGDFPEPGPAGGMIVSDGTDWIPLVPGTDGTILGGNTGTVPSWKNFPDAGVIGDLVVSDGTDWVLFPNTVAATDTVLIGTAGQTPSWLAGVPGSILTHNDDGWFTSSPGTFGQIYATADDLLPTWIGPGTDGQVLTGVTGDFPSFQNGPSTIYGQIGSISAGADVTINAGTALPLNDFSIFRGGTSINGTTGINIATTGVYKVTGFSHQWQSSQVKFAVNDGTSDLMSWNSTETAAGSTCSSLTRLLTLTAGAIMRIIPRVNVEYDRTTAGSDTTIGCLTVEYLHA